MFRVDWPGMGWLENIDQTTVYLVAAGAIVAVALLWDFVVAQQWRHESGSAYGSASWASLAEMKRMGLFGPEGIIIGRIGKRLLRLKTDKPLLMVAPNRSGKGVQMTAVLLSHPGSMVVLDPKGESAAMTLRHRRDGLGQECHVLDPWRITGLPPSRFNPLLWLDPTGPDLIEDVALLSSSIIVGSDKAKEEIWLPEAEAALAGLCLHVLTSEDPENRHFGLVREMLTRDDKGFPLLLKRMLENRGAHGMVQRAAQRLMQKSPRERSGVLTTAQSQTHFLDSQRLIDTMSASDLDIGLLKRKPMTIYLVLPAGRLGTHGRWLRLMVSLCLEAVTRDRTPAEHSVLFCLDEFASAIGRMASVESAMTLLPGYGIQLYPILQDLSQLEDLYPRRWRSFLANAGVIQAFGVNDPGTAQYLSAVLGTRTTTVRQRSLGPAGKGGQNESYSSVGRALLMPYEVQQMSQDKQLLLMPGRKPILADKVRLLCRPGIQGSV